LLYRPARNCSISVDIWHVVRYSVPLLGEIREQELQGMRPLAAPARTVGMEEPSRMDIAEEARLVRRARWGSREAFETICSRHSRAVYALALRLSGNPA